MAEHDPLVFSYVHLAKLPRADEALRSLKKIASLVKPIMRARGWKVKELAEFYPQQQNLLGKRTANLANLATFTFPYPLCDANMNMSHQGLNVDRGRKICLRLRYPGDQNQFMPLENVVDTMLHELCHIVHGPHNSDFHALWDQLRDEQQGLIMKGYTGEGFLSEGRRLGGARLPPHEARRLARESAEKRRRQPTGTGSGVRLGGATPRPGRDMRRVIAEAVERRNKTLKGCGTDNFSDTQMRDIADTATRNGFRTQAEEDEANEIAIAQAMWELVQEDEKAKQGNAYVRPSAAATGSRPGQQQSSTAAQPQSTGQSNSDRLWVCGVCTLANPLNFLCCDVCGSERSSPESRPKPPEESMSTPSTIPSREEASSSSRRRDATVIDLTSSPPRPPPREVKRRQTHSGPQAGPASSSATAQMWQCNFCGTMMEKKWWSCSACGEVKTTSK